ncbi:MAG: prepilin-type N-terminal cleavage/methylation domain-containing protein [Planctomycetota bacterium]|nr:MAG: prepilin-type N-terminal cleavage/methylation domain-containing protein [Planctomycetota bacterium]
MRSIGVRRRGLSLLELLAVVTIMGILAAVVVPRLGTGGSIAKSEACHVQREIIQIQTALFRREKGRFPARDLSDIGRDPKYFPEGLPTCPVDGGPYLIDTSTGLVRGHNH